MSDVTLLRRLTRKSLLKYGYHRDKCVQELIDNSPITLIRDYFKLSNITFIDEILDELEIPAEERILKPGKLAYVDSESAIARVLLRRRQLEKERLGEIGYVRAFKHAKLVGKIRRQKRAGRTNFFNNKSADQLRRKNHGHRD